MSETQALNLGEILCGVVWSNIGTNNSRGISAELQHCKRVGQQGLQTTVHC